MTFAELTQAAMLGTERQPLEAPHGSQPLEALQAQLDANRREETLLSWAALSGLHERAGSLPPRDPGPVPEPCAAETLPRMSGQAGWLLLRLLGGEHAVLLPECLGVAAKIGQLAVPEALPALLDAGSQKPELRELILPLLGARGRWLAALNPAWGWVGGAAEEDESVWQVGEGPARLLFLQRLRRVNPARARELLASTWKEEGPDERARFIAVLETGLSPADEPFLEAALDDKRKEVRRAAASLLARLPESALTLRMIQRAKPLFKFTAGEVGGVLKLKRAKKSVLEVTLPAECDSAMRRDGIEPKPQQGFGEKAWWLIQLLTAPPLEMWTREWNTTAAEIVAASQRGEWSRELFEAWTAAAVNQQNPDWAEALLPVALKLERFARLEPLMSALPPERGEAYLFKVLSGEYGKKVGMQSLVPWLRRHEWSPAFSRALLTWLRTLTKTESLDWVFRNQLGSLASCLAPQTLAEAPTGWPTDSKGWEFWAKGVEEFLAVAQFRTDLHTALNVPQ